MALSESPLDQPWTRATPIQGASASTPRHLGAARGARQEGRTSDRTESTSSRPFPPNLTSSSTTWWEWWTRSQAGILPRPGNCLLPGPQGSGLPALAGVGPSSQPPSCSLRPSLLPLSQLSSVGSRGSDHLCQEAPFPTALTEAAPSPALNTWEAVRLGPSQRMEQRWNVNTGQNSPHISRPHLPTPARGHQALHGTPCPGTATSPVIRAAPPGTLLYPL